MYLFKTSGKTFRGVIDHLAHAFKGRPREWYVGELVLVSKNSADLHPRERQIQYTMKLRSIRPLLPGESDRYWPGTEGRWRYLLECEYKERLRRPFDLYQVIGGEAARAYQAVQNFKRIEPVDEEKILRHLSA